jgi:hypothetical protein
MVCDQDGRPLTCKSFSRTPNMSKPYSWFGRSMHWSQTKQYGHQFQYFGPSSWVCCQQANHVIRLSSPIDMNILMLLFGLVFLPWYAIMGWICHQLHHQGRNVGTTKSLHSDTKNVQLPGAHTFTNINLYMPCSGCPSFHAIMHLYELLAVQYFHHPSIHFSQLR